MAENKNRIWVLIEHSVDGQCESELFFDTLDGRVQMDAAFRQRIKANIGQRDIEGNTVELTESELEDEIERAVQNNYAWTGWERKVQTLLCNTPS